MQLAGSLRSDPKLTLARARRAGAYIKRRGRVHSRQYANFLVCGETIQLQKSGAHIAVNNQRGATWKMTGDTLANGCDKTKTQTEIVSPRKTDDEKSRLVFLITLLKQETGGETSTEHFKAVNTDREHE